MPNEDHLSIKKRMAAARSIVDKVREASYSESVEYVADSLKAFETSGYARGRDAAMERCARIAEVDIRSRIAKFLNLTPRWYLHALAIAPAIRMASARDRGGLKKK